LDKTNNLKPWQIETPAKCLSAKNICVFGFGGRVALLFSALENDMGHKQD